MWNKKIFKVILNILLILTLILSCKIQAQNPLTRTENIVQYNNIRNVPSAIYNIKTKRYNGSPEIISRDFLMDIREILRMKENLTDLEFSTARKSPAGYHVCFSQNYNGIHVIGSESVVSMNNQNEVTMLINNYKPGIELKTEPSYEKNSALLIARNTINNGIFTELHPSKAELVIYGDENDNFHLVWKFLIFPEEPRGEWLILVDAMNGIVHEKKNNLMFYEDGTGKVFDPDPGTALEDASLTDQNDADYPALAPAYDTVVLKDLNDPVGGLYYIRGKYAWSLEIADPEVDPVTSTNPDNFVFNRSQPGFQEVNTYYFIDKQRRFIGSLGFNPTWDYPGVPSQAIAFDANGDEGKNAYYTATLEYIVLGSPENDKDLAEDQSVILHEYGHAIHDALISGGDYFPNKDTWGIIEGMADYLAISYRRTTQQTPYRPNHRNNWWNPETIESIKHPSAAKYPDHWGTSNYAKLPVWASTLMDMEYNNSTNPAQGNRLGRAVTTKLILNSLFYVTETSSVQDNVYAILQADRDIYNGAHLGELASIFDARGFFHNNKVSGTISSNTTWSGYKLVTGDVTINNGVTLTISPGTFVFFDDNKKLIINGTLNANGTSNSKIKFDRSGTSGTWGGIQFHSGSSGTLDGCTIENVTTYGGAAIHITNSSPTIENCTIEDMSTMSHGITVSNGGSPYLYNNIIRNGGSNGVFVSNANVYMRENEISGFTNTGKAALCVTTYGDALLGRTIYPYSGDNIFQNNYYGLYSSAHSEIQAGTSSGGLAINNSFLNNTSNAYAINYSTIYAEKNWWSPNPPARTYADGTSYLDYTPYNDDQSLSADTKNSSTNIESVNLLIRARDYLRLGLYHEAFLLYQQIITSKTNSNDIQFAIADLYRLYQNYKNSELINFLQLLADNENSEFRATVLEVLSKLYMRKGLENEFLHYNKLLINSYKNTVNEMYGLVDLFYHYFNKSDYETALQVIESVPLKFSNEDVILSAKWLAYTALDIESSSFSKAGDTIVTLEQEEVANDFILFDNYPNPFNPSTIITFSIPQQAEVELYVYDILGRQVAELVNETLSAGKYNVDFDGSKLTSGMYIYKLSAGSFTESKKMLLVK